VAIAPGPGGDGEEGEADAGPGSAGPGYEGPGDDGDRDEQEQEGGHVEQPRKGKQVALGRLADRLHRVVGHGRVDRGLNERGDDARNRGDRAGSKEYPVATDISLDHRSHLRVGNGQSLPASVWVALKAAAGRSRSDARRITIGP
jgi:hypothetical protein